MERQLCPSPQTVAAHTAEATDQFPPSRPDLPNLLWSHTHERRSAVPNNHFSRNCLRVCLCILPPFIRSPLTSRAFRGLHNGDLPQPCLGQCSITDSDEGYNMLATQGCGRPTCSAVLAVLLRLYATNIANEPDPAAMGYFCCLFASGGETDDYEELSNTTSPTSILKGKERLEQLNVLEDEGANYQNDLWQLVLAEKFEMFTAVRNRRVAGDVNSDETFTAMTSKQVRHEFSSISPDTFLQTLTTVYTNSGHAKRMPTIRRVFEGMRPFVVAVNTLVQTDTVAALVWGSLSLVFEAVLRYAKFWDELSAMFDDLTRSLPRFHGYIQVLHTPRLHAALRKVYSTFLDICIMTLDCLHSNRCFVVLRMQWSSFLTEFNKSVGELSIANREFEQEAQLAHVQQNSRRQTEILAAVQNNQLATSVAVNTVKSNITMSRNTKFTGRDDVLALIHSTLEPSFKGEHSQRPFRSCLIHAIGGMGKTETALEYTYRFGMHHYSYIFWLKAQTRTSLQESFFDVVDRLGIIKDKDITPSKKREIGLNWFRATEKPWLLVYDNAEDPATVREYLPASVHGGAALITSQNPAFSHTTSYSIQLHQLPLAEGSALIQVYLGRGGSEQDAAEKLSASLGGLPLAIVHFAGYIARSQCPIEHISKNLNQRLQTSSIWKMSKDTPSDARAYQQTLDTVWDLAFQRLTSDARLLLEYIAFLDPDDIPVDLFIGDSRLSSALGKPVVTDGQWQYWDVHRFNEAIGILLERNLVNRTVQENIDSLRTHRALQICILQRLDEDLPRRASRFADVLAIVRRAIPVANISKRSDSSQFPSFAKYFPQVANVHKVFINSDPPLDGSLTLATVLDDTCYYCYTVSNNIAALQFAETGESICSSLGDDAHAKRLLPNLLTIISMIIHYHGIKGRERALDMMQRVVELRREELKSIPQSEWTEMQSVNFARAHADLGWELCESNRPADAAPLYLECIKIYTELNNKTRLAMILVNQLIVYSTEQKKDETRAQGKDALETIIDILGEDNPLVVLAQNQISLAYFTIGDIAEALKLMDTVFQKRLLTLGHSNDLTLASQYCVAVYQQNLGQLDVAEQNLREVLAKGHQTNDWREEDIIRAKFRLSLVLRAQAKTAEADEIRNEIENYLADMRPSAQGEKGFTDADDMALLDIGVTLDHGRTAGIWSNGELW